MTREHRIIYLCPHCFQIGEEPCECCGREMTRFDAGAPGDPRSKPLMDEHGNLKTRAPAWWVERYAWWIRNEIARD